jgi:hypothetical protein
MARIIGSVVFATFCENSGSVLSVFSCYSVNMKDMRVVHWRCQKLKFLANLGQAVAEAGAAN